MLTADVDRLRTLNFFTRVARLWPAGPRICNGAALRLSSHAFCHLAVPRNEGALCRYWCQFHCEELINRVPPPKLNAGCYIFQLWKPASQRRVPGKWNKYREGRYNFNLHDCIGRYDHSVCARRCMALILRLIFSRLPFRAIRRLL